MAGKATRNNGRRGQRPEFSRREAVGCDEWLDKELNMAQEIEVLLTKQFDEVQIDQFAIDWLVRQTAEFGEPGRIAERLLGIVSDLLDIDAG